MTTVSYEIKKDDTTMFTTDYQKALSYKADGYTMRTVLTEHHECYPNIVLQVVYK